MARAGITSAVDAKVSAPETEPGYLIEIQFPSGLVRHSSRELETWNSGIWIPSTAKVSGLEGGGQRGTLAYFDADTAIRAVILTDGINDRRIRIWKFYVGALATPDPVPIFDGVGDGAKIRGGLVTIGLARSGTKTLMTPRLRIGPATGFNHLQPAGAIIQWAGRNVRLERSRG